MGLGIIGPQEYRLLRRFDRFLMAAIDQLQNRQNHISTWAVRIDRQRPAGRLVRSFSCHGSGYQLGVAEAPDLDIGLGVTCMCTGKQGVQLNCFFVGHWALSIAPMWTARLPQPGFSGLRDRRRVSTRNSPTPEYKKKISGCNQNEWCRIQISRTLKKMD